VRRAPVAAIGRFADTPARTANRPSGAGRVEEGHRPEGATVDTSVATAATVTAGEQELVAARRQHGETHPQTLVARRALAALYRRARRFDEAIEQLQLLVVGLAQRHGADHPDTLEAHQRLAFAYRLADRMAEAEGAYQAVLAGRARTIGEHHPDTLATQEHLAAVRRRRWHHLAG
jgi:predicted nucleic acid-binding protein